MKSFAIFLTVCATVILGNSTVKAQSLEQTVGFILSNGEIDPTNIAPNTNGSLTIPQHTMFGLNILMPTITVNALDRPNCVVEIFGQAAGGQPAKYTRYYLNRITGFHEIEQSASTINGILSVVHIWADSELAYMWFAGGGVRADGHTPLPQELSPITDIAFAAVESRNLARMHKAIDYLYSKHCSIATKKNAF